MKLIVGYQNQFNLIPYFGLGPYIRWLMALHVWFSNTIDMLMYAALNSIPMRFRFTIQFLRCIFSFVRSFFISIHLRSILPLPMHRIRYWVFSNRWVVDSYISPSLSLSLAVSLHLNFYFVLIQRVRSLILNTPTIPRIHWTRARFIRISFSFHTQACIFTPLVWELKVREHSASPITHYRACLGKNA